MEEYLDIVNEDGNLTGEKELRSVCHEKGLWHRTVHIYLYRIIHAKIEILVHLRSKEKESNPNKWDIRFGGHVKSGDSQEKATLDELNEEIGLIPNPDVLKFVEIFKYDGRKNREFCYTSIYKLDDDINSLVFNDGEVQEVRWMSFNQIKDEAKTNPEKWTSSYDGVLQLEKMLTQNISL